MRALSGAALVGATLGVMLGGSFIAGGAARASAAQARAGGRPVSAVQGVSAQAQRTETARMDPGAAAQARPTDPVRPEAPGPAGLRLARFEITPTASPKPEAPRPSLQPPRAARVAHRARELDCLTDAVYYEARGESAEGQAAVAQVVLNRVHSRGFPNTVCGVVFQGAQSHECQFSFACDGATNRVREPRAWRRAQGIAARALGGFVMAEVRGATHFHVARLGAIWGDGLMRVAQIGTHVFYKLTRHGAFVDHAGHPADGDGDAVPAEGGQPTLILAAALTGKPAAAPAAAAPAAPAAPAAQKPVPVAAATPPGPDPKAAS